MFDYDPLANPKNEVVFGNARFQVLTERIVRMEWARDGRFEDRPSLAAVNRQTPPVRFNQRVSGKRLAISTACFTLEYRSDGKKFSRENLQVVFRTERGRTVWQPGKKNDGNLRGTARTLDGYDGDRHYRSRKKLVYCDGFLSTDGWALHDDTASVVLDARPGAAPWVAARPAGTRQDLYLLMHGRNYREALAEASAIFGRQPLPPRFTLGYWWSRFWGYTDREIEELVRQFDLLGVPLDVMVVDMDWHLEGWTGYTWDERLFPDYREFLRHLKTQGLKITLNLHPADGVAKYEAQFAEMARTLGYDPGKIQKIEFDCTDPKFIDAYFKILHHPYEKEGVDFWWMDWQQGQGSKMPGLDPLPWLNCLHSRDMEKRGKKRPLIFSRFGGPGSGRYPIGFSGDTFSTWKSLALQPYFTATAANTLFGYWSHDIGGHMPGAIDGELYLRWIQFGVFSPILRTHTTRNEKAERRVWEYPAPYSHAMIGAIRRRYEMVPYIYTENRRAVGTGVSLVHPMYYDYPDCPAAYRARGQYMFGDQMLVAPVVSPASPKNEMARVAVWLPQGAWIDTATGDRLKGGKTYTRSYLYDEIPVFVRPGTILPGQTGAQRLNDGCYKNLLVTAFPGSGSYTLYEDDGVSGDYITGKFAEIGITQKSCGNTRIVAIGPAVGTYPGFRRSRSLEIRLPHAAPPKSVTVGGRTLRWRHRLTGEGWTYDGSTATTVVRIARCDVAAGIVVKIVSDEKTPDQLAAGVAGLFRRLERIRELATYTMRILNVEPYCRDRLPVELAQAGNRIGRNPSRFADEIRTVRRKLPILRKSLPGPTENTPHPHLREYTKKALEILKEIV